MSGFRVSSTSTRNRGPNEACAQVSFHVVHHDPLVALRDPSRVHGCGIVASGVNLMKYPFGITGALKDWAFTNYEHHFKEGSNMQVEPVPVEQITEIELVVEDVNLMDRVLGEIK